MQPALSPSALARLRQPRPYPAVSLLMPTHRREPDNAQDPVRLRNLLAETKRQLEADPAVTRERRNDVVQQLERATADIDLVHAEDGLVIFAAPGEHEVWYLSRSVPERVVLSDTFLTRNLVAAQASERTFWLLAVSADRVTLWNGGPDHVVEERRAGFPLTRSLQDPDAEPRGQQQIGDVPSTFRDEASRLFLRDADNALGRVLEADPRPLYITGETAALSLLREAGTAAKNGTPVPHGGLAHASPEAVWQAIQPVIAAEEEKNVAAVLRDLEKARGRKEFAAGVDEVWQGANAGRLRLLAVEENYRLTVRDDGDHLVPAESTDLDARDDIIDEIVEQALETGAEVRFVPDGTLDETAHIAGALRY
ncbi:baeRF3 domain-containing protein [Streptomyces himalayensis]|uniref:Chemotaxis protein n=2 Tax=Streptomyces himalayensis TaxID=2820085 RepID=A0A7W2D2S9_9ACTN|nr:chemotaxis protein [Streptomyces himalayensis]MBA2947439.1 chemotaxis protein [Streptomyces himalayensis subsp. himalayensis]MBA4863727.1 chemotaxis protein [Streptomyces himalayensis subsp. aureolus]